MASRRTYGTGSLVERPVGSGRWLFRYVVGVDPISGKLLRQGVTIEAKSEKAAQAKARKLLLEAGADAVTGASVTLNQLLAEWMVFQSSRGRSPTTLNGYQSLVDHHIKNSIGNIKIGKLTPHQLDSLYSKCSRDGLSPRTVRNLHNVISATLNQAVRWGWLDKNPAAQATLPEPTPLRVVSPTPEQARELIAACQQKDETLGAFVFLAAVTGCRRGEIAALRWSSFQNGLLNIGHSAFKVKTGDGLKSTKSGRERIVHLDQTVQDWLAYCRARCEAQASEWDVELVPNGFIFSSSPDGSNTVNLDSISRGVRQVAKRLGMGSIHLHSLRHFAATELLAAGVSPRDTADMLGHADPSLTLRVYAHASAERQKAAAGVLADIVKSPGQQSIN